MNPEWKRLYVQRSLQMLILKRLIRQTPAWPEDQLPLLRGQIQEARENIAAREAELAALPLEVGEVIEIRRGVGTGMLFMVAEIHHGYVEEVTLNYITGAEYATLQHRVLDSLAIKRLGFWSGRCPVPPIGTAVHLLGAYGAGIVTGYETVNGWLGVQVRYQTKDQSPANLCFFGKEVRW